MGKSVIMEKAGKVSEEQVQKALFAGLALFVLLFPLGQYIWPHNIIGNQIQEVFLIVLMLYFICVLGMEYRNKRIPIQRVSALALLGMTLFGFLSCLWSGDLINTIYGDEFQGEGFITLICYYALFFAAAHLKEKGYRRWLFYFVCLVLGFIAFYGVLQFFQMPLVLHKAVKVAVYPTKNQNFYGAFPVLLIGLVFGMILYGQLAEKKKKVFWHGLAMLGFAAAISSDSLLVYVGIIMQFALALFLEFFTKRKQIKPILLLAAEFLFVFLVFDFASGGEVLKEFLSLFIQIQEEGSMFGDSVGTGRMSIWKATLQWLPQHWAFGCGIERFHINYVISGRVSSSSDAHNEYLHMWAEQGLFVLIFYLIFLFALFLPGLLQFREKERYESDFVSKAALFAFFGYIAQAFVNVRVVQVAPYFWLCCGLLYVRKRPKEPQ